MVSDAQRRAGWRRILRLVIIALQERSGEVQMGRCVCEFWDVEIGQEVEYT